MNELLTSQIDRAKELLEQLKKSIDVDSSSRTISPLTLNITQEILCKVRHLLDQLMNNFFKKNYATKLSPSQKKNARRNVYFPISSTKIGIADCLKKAEMQNLEQ